MKKGGTATGGAIANKDEVIEVTINLNGKSDVMKKIIPTILPSLLIFSFVYYDHFIRGKDSLAIIAGIYLLFPIVFIFQGVICSNLKSSMIMGFLLSSIAVILPISLWYNMSSVIPAVIIYILLGVIAFFSIKRINKTSGDKK